MLTVDLLRLWREQTLPVRGSIDPNAGLWDGSELAFAEPVDVVGAASVTADGAVVVRGSWKCAVAHDCDRCLERLRLPIARPMNLVYVPPGSWESEVPDDDPDVRRLDARAHKLDLIHAIREEVLLEAPRYVLPAEGDDGRCVRCGVPVDRFRNVRSEPEADADPRWAALTALQSDQTN